MTLPQISKLFGLTFLLVCGCKTTKIYGPTLEEVKARDYRLVSMNELMQYKEKYHGQYIETTGFFHHAFEECAIYYDIDIPSGDATIKYRDGCGLWIDFHPTLPEYRRTSVLDSLQNKKIVVRGLFDTLQVPIMRCFRANLRDAYLVKDVSRDK